LQYDDHKPARSAPTDGLVCTAIILNIFAVQGSVPAVRVKGRIAAFIGNDKIKTGLDTRSDALPA